MAILMGAADALGSFAGSGLRVNDTVAQFASNFYMQAREARQPLSEPTLMQLLAVR